MCGIAGRVDNSQAPVDIEPVRRMMKRLAHRGPDDSGEYQAPGVVFGFRRLAIIDLSPAGHQPMTNEDGSLWLIFNGEIYNYQELRSGLQAGGHQFRSATDSETILHAYEEYGLECLQHFRGMFAFALWDTKRQRLFLARDRFGKKPLFYHVTGGQLTFASELNALLAAVPKPPINFSALNYYFRFQFIPSPHTIYDAIEKLPPAHYAIFQRGQLTVKRYWDLTARPKSQLSLADAGAEFERRFRGAVKLRLVSDVPLGVFLSGGLDSSIITALVSSELSAPVKTFSIGFAEESHNELPLARLVAEKYKTDHHEFIIKPNVIELLPMLMRHYGEPFADSSAVATYSVARETRKFVTVALSGDGGDENFAGYDKYAFLSSLATLDGLPQSLRRGLRQPLRFLSQLIPSAIGRKVRVGATLFAGDFIERYIDLFFLFARNELGGLLQPEIRQSARVTAETLARQRLGNLPADASLVEKITALDLKLYLPEGLMTKADIATMANSLEARAPFLDHTVVEFTTTLPTAYKMAGTERKVLLRRQFGHLLPPRLLTERKRGFDLPVNTWLRGELKNFFLERVRDSSFRQLPYFQWPFVDALIQDHFSERNHHGMKLWSLLCFAVWHDATRV